MVYALLYIFRILCFLTIRFFRFWSYVTFRTKRRFITIPQYVFSLESKMIWLIPDKHSDNNKNDKKHSNANIHPCHFKLLLKLCTKKNRREKCLDYKERKDEETQRRSNSFDDLMCRRLHSTFTLAGCVLITYPGRLNRPESLSRCPLTQSPVMHGFKIISMLGRRPDFSLRGKSLFPESTRLTSQEWPSRAFAGFRGWRIRID